MNPSGDGVLSGCGRDVFRRNYHDSSGSIHLVDERG